MSNVGSIDRIARIVAGLLLIAFAIPIGFPQTGWNWIGSSLYILIEPPPPVIDVGQISQPEARPKAHALDVLCCSIIQHPRGVQSERMKLVLRNNSGARRG